MSRIKTVICIGLFQAVNINAFACSGEGAGEQIKFNSNISSILFALSILIVLTIFLVCRKTNRIKKLKIHPALVFILIVFHPRIWLNALSGDCGFLLFHSSIVITIILFMILVLTYVNFRKSLKKRNASS